MSTWEQRMAARTRDRREIVEEAEQIARQARNDALNAEAKAKSDRLRRDFLDAHPDLDPNWKWAIINAPTQVYYYSTSTTGRPYLDAQKPYDPADYAWTKDDLWAGTADLCRECVVAVPPDAVKPHFGWHLMQTCHFQCGHAHHDGEVWYA